MMNKVLIGIPSAYRADNVKTMKWLRPNEAYDIRISVPRSQCDLYLVHYSGLVIAHDLEGTPLGAQRNFILEYACRNGYDVLLMMDDDVTCLKMREGLTAGGYPKLRRVADADFPVFIANALALLEDRACLTITRSRLNALTMARKTGILYPRFDDDVIFINLHMTQGLSYDTRLYASDTPEFHLSCAELFGMEKTGLWLDYCYDTPISGAERKEDREEGGIDSSMPADKQSQNTLGSVQLIAQKHPGLVKRVKQYQMGNYVRYYAVFNYAEVKARQGAACQS